MNEHRKQILEMVAAGTITVDEGGQLLAALEEKPEEALSAATGMPKTAPRYLRVVVDSPGNFDGDGPGKVNIRIPIQLLRAGVQLASLIPPSALTQVNEELRKSGVPVDLTQLKPAHIEDLIEQLSEIAIDVDQPDAKVRVFCE